MKERQIVYSKHCFINQTRVAREVLDLTSSFRGSPMQITLISSAFQRCRVSEHLCCLSVLLKSSPPSDPPFVQISISDTGVGSSLEEFLDLKSTCDVISTEKFDGLLSVVTTGVSDDEIHRYNVNLREGDSSKVVTQLPSNPKNGAKFSGTEVCISLFEDIHALASQIRVFIKKMLILKTPNVAIEVVVECADFPQSQSKNVFVVESDPSLFSAPNVERLKSGLEDYVFKHGNNLKQKCDSCFPSWEHLQVGIGIACSTESLRNAGLVMEVVIIMSQLETTRHCVRARGSKTEVLYFKDFVLCPISQSSLNGLTSIDWKSYGLTLREVLDQGGCFLEWENLPPDSCINIVIHCYPKQVMIPAARNKTQPDCFLTKRAIKLALDDLKEKHSGILLSARARKVSKGNVFLYLVCSLENLVPKPLRIVSRKRSFQSLRRMIGSLRKAKRPHLFFSEVTAVRIRHFRTQNAFKVRMNLITWIDRYLFFHNQRGWALHLLLKTASNSHYY